MSSVDIIKQYLVSIGFNIDNSSFNKTQQKMGQAEKTVNSFAKNNGKSVDSMKSSIGDISALTRVSIEAMGKIFPAMKGPLNQIISNVNLAKKVFTEFANTAKKSMDDANNPKKNTSKGSSKSGSKSNSNTSVLPPLKIPDDYKDVSNVSKSLTTLTQVSKGAETGLETLGASGGEAMTGLAATVLEAVPPQIKLLALLAIGIGLVAKGLSNMANSDIEYQKLARQLWTTKENAKEVSMALKTMGVTMQDLWFSPQLLAQFNALRKDSAELKLPDSFNKNIVIVQELGFEFQRVQQAVQLLFQWIGANILQYVAAPLADIKNKLNGFNNEFLKAIPAIATVIGGAIGIIARLILDIVDALMDIGSVVSDVFGFFIDILDKIPAPIKEILKIIGMVAVAIICGPLLVFDDLMTAMRGGKSVIGGWAKNFVAGCAVIKKWIGDITAPFIAFGKTVKNIFADIGKFINTYIIAPIENVVKKVEDAIKAIKKAAKDVKDLPGNGLKAIENAASGAFNSLTGQSSVNHTVPSTSSTSNSSSSVANSNNKTANANTFNIYGTNPVATANAVTKNLTGLQTHNLQGVY